MKKDSYFIKSFENALEHAKAEEPSKGDLKSVKSISELPLIAYEGSEIDIKDLPALVYYSYDNTIRVKTELDDPGTIITYQEEKDSMVRNITPLLE